MVYHNIIPHGSAIGSCYHFAVISRVDSSSFRCGEIHSVVKLLYSQSRMYSVSVIVRNPGICRQRKLKHASVICEYIAALLQKLNLCFLCPDFLFIFSDGFFFIINICLVTDDIASLLLNQLFQILLLCLNGFFCFVQNLFFQFKLIPAQLDIFPGRLVVLPHLPVICCHFFHIIQTVQEISEAFGFQHHIQDTRRP